MFQDDQFVLSFFAQNLGNPSPFAGGSRFLCGFGEKNACECARQSNQTEAKRRRTRVLQLPPRRGWLFVHTIVTASDQRIYCRDDDALIAMSVSLIITT